MRLRTQLVLASFLLAVLPLAALVLYSYESSKDALEVAYRREAARMTRQMDARVAAIRNELDVRMAAVTALPLEQTMRRPEKNGALSRAIDDEIAMAVGESAPLVESVSFLPARLAPPPPPEVPVAPHHRQSGQATESRPPVPQVASVPAAAAAAAGAASSPEAPSAAAETEDDAGDTTAVPMVEPEPIVIDVPRVASVGMPPEALKALAEVGRLAGEIGSRQMMTPAEKAKLQDKLRARQADLEQMIQKATQIRIERASERSLGRDRANHRMMLESHRLIVKPAEAVKIEPEPASPSEVTAPAPSAVRAERPTESEVRDRSRKVALILGHDFNLPVENGGKVVGRVTAQVSPDEVIRRVLGSPSEDGSEVAFAVDADGHLYSRSDAERQTVQKLGIPQKVAANQPLHDVAPDWVVAMTRAGSLRIGVARQIGENFDLLRRAAARNFACGLGLVVIALLGLVPIANHMTRDVQLVTAGAERISQGDLQTRVPVRSKNEFGQLASAFNRMAVDLSAQRMRLQQEEQARREQEVHQGILAVEYDRKAGELEEARRFQLSMLPKSVPLAPGFEVAAYTRTATEVGGDYYDFHVGEEGALSVTIGDATGHGAKAGTMVTVVKTLFAGYGGRMAPGAFLGQAAETIKRMDLGRMAMALSIARFAHGRVTIASAGMPPVLVRRAGTGEVEEVALEATPLGTLGTEYGEFDLAVAEGDTILLMSDGFPELTNEAGTQLGYAAALDAFAQTSGTARDVIDAIVASAHEWHGDQPPNDDMTFVAVRIAAA